LDSQRVRGFVSNLLTEVLTLTWLILSGSAWLNLKSSTD